ncbi:MAG: UbiD family decarboxylase [Dehalococcoidia bacterium]|nr:UbiD family decarboxylase [Dehalococcoidia bacterium]MDZ4246151.1 UbiD family decarboxylase [Dehalococcoidia bacterium]
MAFKDLREWMALVESKGELKRIKAEVDWKEEIGAITREVASRRGTALLFENIKDYHDTSCTQLLTGTLGSRGRVRMALGLPDTMRDREIINWLRGRLRTTIDPVIVNSGPTKENILKGDGIDLYNLPVPFWNPLDGGRYIFTLVCMVTRDPFTGEHNVGTYRGMIVGKNKVAVFLARSQDWGKHFTAYESLGQEMPVAAVLGWDPNLFMCSGSSVVGEEYKVCSAIRGEPVPLVKCETSDILVPASAEIVIEGKISTDPATYVMEGPFAEYPGYYAGMPEPRPVVRVECITHRNDPILVGLVAGATPGRYPSDGFFLKYFWPALMWSGLEDNGIPGITDITFDGWPEIMKVRIHKSYRGHAQQLATAIWGSKFANHGGKILIVVDDDIDIRSREAVDWALAYRVNAAMGDIAFFDTLGSPLDPSVPMEDRDIIKYGQSSWRRILIDATINWGLEPRPEWGGKRYPPLGTEITPAMQELITRRWKEYGLPD